MQGQINYKYFKIAALCGLTAVALGAFGAHGLKALISTSSIDTFQIGVRYQYYHTIALLLSAILPVYLSSTKLRWASLCFFIGILLFSGSLYLLACRSVLGIEHWWFLGPITPIGGVFFMLGWGFLFFAAFDKKNNL